MMVVMTWRAIGVVMLATWLIGCGGNSTDKPPADAGGVCGDGVVNSGEDCDDGAANGTTGCTATCTFACVDPAIDCAAAPTCQVATCGTDHVCAFIAETNGTSCGAGQVCKDGACISDGTCGNGIVDGIEDCDFGGGSNGPNTGCKEDCTFSCADQAACDDANPCNGAETCDAITVGGQMGKKCSPGTGLANGTSCGAADICINQACTPGICGDSYTTTPEECDDANVTMGDGCENNCKYTCLSTDVTRNCTPADPCQGQGTCSSTTHTCAPGTPLANNTPCGTGGYCKAGVCTQPVCTNGMVELGETCDDGNQTNGDGCDDDCTYSCVNAATDCGTPAACQKYQCTAGYTCQSVPDTAQNGMTCGTSGQMCNNGSCTGGVCGNGIKETGEQCDFGAGNGPNTGCETNCTFSCTMAPSSCEDGNTCNGVSTCTTIMGPNNSGQRCVAGTPLADNTNCGTAKICKMQLCVASVCGDAYVDTSIGESCEPPNTASCDAACHVKVCGDGVRAGSEQCDDGNTTNLDGCGSTCKFEQCQRINDLDIQFGTDAYCTKNAFGAAAGSITQGMIGDAVSAGVTDGSITVIFQMLNLDDLTGTADPSLSLGVLSGAPAAGTGYNGNSDLDWWYTIAAAGLDASRVPVKTVTATIAAKVLDAGPGDMTFKVNFVGVDVTMDMFNARIRAPIGAATAPLTSTGTTPGHLAAEQLDPALTSFATMGTANAPAELCGATTAQSLANTRVPASVISYCSNYTIANSLLDLYIGGCTYAFIFQIIKATQPDTARNPSDVYKFTANAQRVVTSCTKNSQPAVLSDCLQNAGYTSFYKLTTDRVIGK